MWAPITDDLNVFHVTKRQGDYKRWEPIHIGTQDDPLYDERLSWEGKRDKMPQAYAMCLLDYDFAVLDNAFLVHRPGIKKAEIGEESWRQVVDEKQKILIQTDIRQQLQFLYGHNSYCSL